MLGGMPVPVYADSVADELAYVLAHADVRFAVVEDQEQVDKILSVSDRLPRSRRCSMTSARAADYDHAGSTPWTTSSPTGGRPWRRIAALGPWLDREIAARRGADISIILYTSGTTGHSKGVLPPAGRCIARQLGIPSPSTG